MADPARVMAVGTVMVDVLAVDLPHVAEPGHVVYTRRPIESHIGGHPIDVAIDLAEMGYPAPAIGVVAAVGTGMYGNYVREVIARYDFRTYLQEVPTHDTGRNMVLEVEREDRRFHIDPGANWFLQPSHVADAIESFAPEVLTLRPGYTGIDLHLADLLEDLDDVLVVMDVMQPHPSRPPDLVLAALSNVDVVHCNPHEAMTVTGESTVESAVRRLLNLGPRLVLLTSGGHGARAITATHTVTQPGYRIDVVDPTGCGDAFCAGAIEWLIGSSERPLGAATAGLTPDDLPRLLAHAQAVGAAAATAAGCVEGVSRRLVDHLRESQAGRLLAASRVVEN